MSVMLSGSIFQSTLPGWGATGDGNQPTVATAISIHAPRVGSDRRRKSTDCGHSYFNPRSPGGERRGASRSGSPGRTDFNPRSPDGERQRAGGRQDRGGDISIHAPRMGSDTHRRLRRLGVQISIHAPRMGSDFGTPSQRTVDCRFQSTLPGWGATFQTSWPKIWRIYFNPRSPDGERRDNPTGGNNPGVFQSTLPGWGATKARHRRWTRNYNFNPRSPDGERPETIYRRSLAETFQSTLPGWGATAYISYQGADPKFQSTLPGWGATWSPARHSSSFRLFQSTLPGWGATVTNCRTSANNGDFNPRSPDGERPMPRYQRLRFHIISIHAPRMGSDTSAHLVNGYPLDFNPRSPDGERLHSVGGGAAEHDFNPRSPDGERLTVIFGNLARGQFQSTLPGWGATAVQRHACHHVR